MALIKARSGFIAFEAAIYICNKYRAVGQQMHAFYSLMVKISNLKLQFVAFPKSKSCPFSKGPSGVPLFLINLEKILPSTELFPKGLKSLLG
ncbi:MAG: hypothetical protein AAF798_01950, partial [Bacteroidota bacterium]